VNELVGIGGIPLLREKGWTRHQEISRSHLDGADGVVAHKAGFVVSDHPVCAASVASRHFFISAATPPL